MNIIKKRQIIGINLKLLIFSFILLFPFTFLASAPKYLTTYNIFILPPAVDIKSFSLWNTVKGDLTYNIKRINYYKIIEDEELSDIILKFKITDVRSVFDFKIEYKLSGNAFFYSVKSKKDYEEFQNKFIKDLKQTFPLKGVIFKTNGLFLQANIGKYYDVKKGDIFAAVNKDNFSEIKGIAIVLNSFDQYSDLIMASKNQIINNNDILLPFTYDLNLQYHLFNKISGYSNIKGKYQFTGIYGPSYKVFSSLSGYTFIADEKEAGLFINKSNVYEKIEDVNYNQIVDAQYNLRENYMSCLFINGMLKIIKLPSLDRYCLKFDNAASNYNLILEKEKDFYTSTAEDVLAQCSFFYKEDSLVFLDKMKKKVVAMDIKNNSFNEINITNKIILPSDPNRTNNITNTAFFKKVLVSPNNKKLILMAENQAVLIKDLDTGEEELIKNVNEIKMSKSGVYLICRQDSKIIFHDLYTAGDLSYTANGPFNDFMLSYSEKFLVFLNEENPNNLNYFDREENKSSRDVFNNRKVKAIFKTDALYDDNILLYGKLFDADNNMKLDYRDLNSVVYFNFSTGAYSTVLDNIDDYYGLNNYKKYLIYSRFKELFITEMKYERISK